MTRRVPVSQTARKALEAMPAKEKRRVTDALAALGHDATHPRPKVDIKPLEGTHPAKWRLRVGPWRAVYRVEGDEVLVLEVFRRGRGYRVE
jgi:mRNA interferase RelE/StbE